MTKKDYEAIAAAIRPFAIDLDPPKGSDRTGQVASDAIERTARDIAERIAHLLAQDNPRFDRARFLRACGIEEDR